MSEEISNEVNKTWRNTSRIRIGQRKGQFKKKSVQMKSEKRKALKRLCEENRNVCAEKDVLAGRELHEPSILAKEMWCPNCNIPLSFEFAQRKEQKGLGFIYDIKCCKCPLIKSVNTGKMFRQNNSYMFAMNAQAAVGIIDSGIGETQFNLLLSAMNFGTVSDTLLKRYERIVGPKIEELAMESCSASLEEEIDMGKNANDIVVDKTGEGKLGLTFGFDVGWQKRGTGRAYNSLSGHGALIGYYSKKICSYAIRSKSCRLCSSGKPHDCRLNYNGSSKGMEADIAIELYTKNPLFDKHKVFGARLIMDNDSSTIAGLRKVSPHSIELWADKNHSVKAFSNALYGLSLPKAQFEYFASTLSGVIAECRGQPAILKAKMEAIVPHAFGDHTLCTFHDEKENYVYQRIPGRKPLQNKDLQIPLEEIMSFIYSKTSRYLFKSLK